MAEHALTTRPALVELPLSLVWSAAYAGGCLCDEMSTRAAKARENFQGSDVAHRGLSIMAAVLLTVVFGLAVLVLNLLP